MLKDRAVVEQDATGESRLPMPTEEWRKLPNKGKRTAFVWIVTTSSQAILTASASHSHLLFSPLLSIDRLNKISWRWIFHRLLRSDSTVFAFGSNRKKERNWLALEQDHLPNLWNELWLSRIIMNFLLLSKSRRLLQRHGTLSAGAMYILTLTAGLLC